MNKRISGIFLLVLLTVSLWADSSLRGAAAAKADASPTVEAMLRYAIEDEYLAHAEYAAIIAKFGAQNPFSNIIASEETHIAWLSAEYAARKLSVPADEGAKHVVMPATLEDAFKAGVQAEIDNIAMYDRFLKDPLIAKAENAAVRDLFTRLRDASKNHLRAFENGLNRRGN